MDSGSNKLVATTGEILSEMPEGPDLTAEQQAQLWTQAEPLLAQIKQSSEEDSAMFIPEVGLTVGLLLGTAAAASSAVQDFDNYMLGVCQVSRPNYSAQIRPEVTGDIYINQYKSELSFNGFSFKGVGTKVTLVKAPSHGKIEKIDSKVSNNYFVYMPNDGYFGQDRFAIQVEKNGVKVRIQYLIEVAAEGEAADYLCDRSYWKISSSTPSIDNANLLTLLKNFNIDSSVNVTFSDMAGGAIGQATG